MAREMVPVFDIGRVLIRWEPERALRRYFSDEPALARFIEAVGFAEWHGRQDAGRAVAEAVAEASARLPDHAEAIAGFYENWLEAIPGEVPGTRAIFEALLARGPVYGISNFSRELFDRTVPAYPFLGRFTGLVLSGDERINKPDPRIYRALLSRYGLKAADCVFIDDSPANVAAARAEGMAGIVFSDAPSLSASLRGMGLCW